MYYNLFTATQFPSSFILNFRNLVLHYNNFDCIIRNASHGSKLKTIPWSRVLWILNRCITFYLIIITWQICSWEQIDMITSNHEDEWMVGHELHFRYDEKSSRHDVYNWNCYIYSVSNLLLIWKCARKTFCDYNINMSEQ